MARGLGGSSGRQPQSLAQSEELRRAHNPAFIPRNHLVEKALAAAGENDLGVMQRLLEVLATPYDHTRHAPEYRAPAPGRGLPDVLRNVTS